MKRVYKQRPHSLDEIAATFIAGLPLEEQLQAATAWQERKQAMAKQLKIESEAANLLNQGMMKLEADRLEIVAQMKREEQTIKDAEKRYGDWQRKLAAHDKMAAPFIGKSKPAKKKAKRNPKRAEASKAAAEHIAQHEAEYDAEDVRQNLVQP